MKLFYIAMIFSLIMFTGCDEDPNPTKDNDEVSDSNVFEEQGDEPVQDNEKEENDETNAQPDEAEDKEVEDEEVKDAEVDDEEMMDEVADDDVVTEPFDFEGKWAQKNVLYSDSETMGQKFRAETATVLLIEQTVVDNKVHVVSKTCKIVVDTGSDMMAVEISDLYIENVIPTEFDYTVTDNGHGYDMVANDVLEIRGCTLDDPATDELPKEASDPRVYDQDKDGKPGVTVDMIGDIPMMFQGEGYIAITQRMSNSYSGSTTGGEIKGSVAWSDEQYILEYSHDILKNSGKAVPDNAASNFHVVKIDEDWTCEDIIANESTLFPE